MLGQVVLALVLVAGAFGQRCYLPNIPVKTDCDELKLAGRWYEMKWHAASASRLAQWSNKYSDYYMDLIPISPYGINYYNYNVHSLPVTSAGFHVRQAYFDGIKGSCVTESGNFNRVDSLKPGKYYDTIKDAKFPGNQAWIMDTDYYSWMIKLQCLRVSGSYCEESELQIWTRTPDRPPREVLRKAEIRVRELLVANPCISYTFVIPVVAHSEPQKCASAIPTTLPSYPYSGYGSQLFNYYDSSVAGLPGHLGGLMSHPDLIIPMREMLIAQKAKLVSEKAKMLILKEKLQLEIARLRGVSPVSGGGPKV